jgi:type I restriction enzyme, S subunit
MKERLVPSTWLEKEGRRLDCGPYLSGAVEARLLLESLRESKKPLKGVTKGGLAGIFNGPRFPRAYVTDTAHGVPFLGSTDILDADIRYLPLLSKKQVAAEPGLVVDQGWTLITCSGTIGRMAYARSEMRGMAGSQHFMRVVPAADEIKPGYLYAYLSSRFGLPLVLGGTYGAIIQHIEPQHIADLPVPIAPARIQDAAHKLVEEAAELRTRASTELQAVIREIEQAVGLPALESRYNGTSPAVSVVKAEALVARMDGLFHSNYHRSVFEPLMRLPARRRCTVGDLAIRVFEPARFKRIPVDDPKFGAAFFGTAAIMRADPEPEQYIANRTPGIDELLVGPTTILIPRSGQLVGIIGHAILPHGDVIGGTVSEHGIRVQCLDEGAAGYVWACLSSEYGRRQLKARAFGSSIPTLDVTRVRGAVIPMLDDSARKALGTRAFAVAQARHQAVRKEREARALVELWIEEKGRA